MEIILLEKIVNVGNLGDVVKVRQGYARNFLIPQGKAKRATPDNIAAIEAKRTELEAAANSRLEAARAQAEKLQGLLVQISQKAGLRARTRANSGWTSSGLKATGGKRCLAHASISWCRMRTYTTRMLGCTRASPRRIARSSILSLTWCSRTAGPRSMP